MCILAIYPKNYPKLKDLKNMESMHQNGSGIAFFENGKLFYSKGLKQNAKDIMKIIKDHKPKLPIMIHFRMSSSGVTNCDDLTHPFEINLKGINNLSGYCDYLLAHNGTVNDDFWNCQIELICKLKNIRLPSGNWSDSRAMAFIIAHCGIDYLKKFFDDQKIAILYIENNKMKYELIGSYEKRNKTLLSNTWHVNDSYQSMFHFDLDKYSKKSSKYDKENLCKKCYELGYYLDKNECFEHFDYIDEKINDDLFDDYIRSNERK